MAGEMQKLTDVITPHLRLVRKQQPMVVVEEVRDEPEVEEDPQEYFAPPSDPRLKTCPRCHMPYGGTVHGWVYQGTGPHTGWKTVRIPCPVCTPLARQVQQEEQAIKSQEVIGSIFGDAQIPWQARKWEFDTFPEDGDQEALCITRAFVARHLAGDEDSKRGLYLGGQTGRCKTSLAISALKEVMRASQQPCLFVMTMELMDRLRATYGKGQGSVTHDELITAVCRVTWLVLDDLAVETPTKYVLEKLYYIIEKRRSAGLYTIITSNLNTKQLEGYWRPEGVAEGAFHPGVRVVERIREYCDGIGVRGRNQREASF